MGVNCALSKNLPTNLVTSLVTSWHHQIWVQTVPLVSWMHTKMLLYKQPASAVLIISYAMPTLVLMPAYVCLYSKQVLFILPYAVLVLFILSYAVLILFILSSAVLLMPASVYLYVFILMLCLLGFLWVWWVIFT